MIAAQSLNSMSKDGSAQIYVAGGSGEGVREKLCESPGARPELSNCSHMNIRSSDQQAIDLRTA